ncbi:14336_t:CDS:2, partial [Gigaspora rosea]
RQHAVIQLGILKRSVSFTILLIKITEAKNEEPLHLVSDLVYKLKHFPITNKAPRSYFLVGIVEVKAKDFLQGVAQNAVQWESATTKNKKNIFWELLLTQKNGPGSKLVGIVEVKVKDFLQEIAQCKLSNHLVVVYGDDDIEGQA